tara:strand:+ start:650 stop:850 length:201 start_codon:yes stop_codon:yes gene_type:complete
LELPIFQYVGNNPAKRKNIMKNVFMAGLKMVCAISYILRKISRIPKNSGIQTGQPINVLPYGKCED